MRLQPVHGGRRLLTQVLPFSCVVSPATVGEVDWTVHYPAYVAKDGETARNGGITQYVVCNCSSALCHLTAPLTSIGSQTSGVSGHRLRLWRVDGCVAGCVTSVCRWCLTYARAVELARLFPDNLVMGMEIRAKVKEYVRLRIRALRNETEQRQVRQKKAAPDPHIARTGC